MELRETLRADLVVAMRSGDAQRRDVIRMLLAAIKQVEVDTRSELDNDGIQDVLRKQLKQRQESITDFEKAGRPNEVASELAELFTANDVTPGDRASRQENCRRDGGSR